MDLSLNVEEYMSFQPRRDRHVLNSCSRTQIKNYSQIYLLSNFIFKNKILTHLPKYAIYCVSKKTITTF